MRTIRTIRQLWTVALTLPVLLACPKRTRPPETTQVVSWALDRIDQAGPDLDGKYRVTAKGRGVTIYLFDGPLLVTPELHKRVSVGFNAFPDDTGGTWPCRAHATAVASLAAGGIYGVASRARVVGIQVIQCSDGTGSADAVIAGAEWVAHNNKGPAVANWSFGVGRGYMAWAGRAVSILHEANIPVVVAAGNMEEDACGLTLPMIPGVIAVGAFGIDGVRAPWTAYGECITVYAPGDSVPVMTMDQTGHIRSMAWGGTSFAAALVSGAVAAYLEGRPRTHWSTAYAWIKASASQSVRGADPRRPGLLGPALFVR